MWSLKVFIMQMEEKPVLILLLIQIDGLKQNNYYAKQKGFMVLF